MVHLLLRLPNGYPRRCGVGSLVRRWDLSSSFSFYLMSPHRLNSSICWKLNVLSDRSCCMLFKSCPHNYCACHRVSHSYILSRMEWLCISFHMSLAPSFFLGWFSYLSLCFSLMVLSTECLFMWTFCSCANTHFDRKILTIYIISQSHKLFLIYSNPF